MLGYIRYRMSSPVAYIWAFGMLSRAVVRLTRGRPERGASKMPRTADPAR